jgi:hypothetical protein
MVRSIIHRVWANVAFNCVLLLLMAIPLAGTFGEFHRALPTAMSVQTRSGRKRFNAPLHCGVR